MRTGNNFPVRTDCQPAALLRWGQLANTKLTWFLFLIFVVWGLQSVLPLPPLPIDALRLHSDPSTQLDQERAANQKCGAIALQQVTHWDEKRSSITQKLCPQRKLWQHHTGCLPGRAGGSILSLSPLINKILSNNVSFVHAVGMNSYYCRSKDSCCSGKRPESRADG